MSGPKRIVCLTEETTELLYLLGEDSRIVGITAYTVRPPQAKSEKPVVSAFLSGSISKIRELKPDLIVGFSDIQAKFAKELIEEGLPVLIFNQRSIQEIFEVMQTISNIVGKESQGMKLIDQWKHSIDDMKVKTQNSTRPKVFFQEWDDPIISGIRWVSEAIEIAGGIDIFPEFKNESLARNRIVNFETIAERNPDIIVGSWCGKPVDFDWVRTQESWQNTRALVENRIYEIDSSIILQPGPALFLEGIPTLHNLLRLT